MKSVANKPRRNGHDNSGHSKINVLGNQLAERVCLHYIEMQHRHGKLAGSC